MKYSKITNLTIHDCKTLNRQNGNALFLILIAVILFAALAYAITKSENGNAETITDDKASIAYSRYSAMANLAANEFSKLRMHGCSLDNIPPKDSLPASSNNNCQFWSKHGGTYPYTSSFAAAIPYPYVELGLLYMPYVGTNNPDIVSIVSIGDDRVLEAEAVCNYTNVKNGVVGYSLAMTDIRNNNTAAWQQSLLSTPATSTFPGEFNSSQQFCLHDDATGEYLILTVVEEN